VNINRCCERGRRGGGERRRGGRRREEGGGERREAERRLWGAMRDLSATERGTTSNVKIENHIIGMRASDVVKYVTEMVRTAVERRQRSMGSCSAPKMHESAWANLL
jgi:hypothetical protein